MCIFDKVNPKAKWTPLEGYKYKWPLPHLDIMMRQSSILFLGFGSHRFEVGL